MLPKNISDWHFEQIICCNWGMMHIPMIGREHNNSQSPVYAK
jgi:hypothetical protein